MTASKVTLIDYQMGNLFNTARAFEKVGADVLVTSDLGLIASAERLVLPGVGAFGSAVKVLKETGIADAIKNFAKTHRPFLGICLGMQLLMTSSEEFGFHEGLNFISGTVEGIPNTNVKVPHIGWSDLIPFQRGWENTILKNTPPASSCYFVHSYFVKTKAEEATLAVTEYGGREFAAVVNQENIWGCQFHPERSGPKGLEILQSFLEI